MAAPTTAITAHEEEETAQSLPAIGLDAQTTLVAHDPFDMTYVELSPAAAARAAETYNSILETLADAEPTSIGPRSAGA